jgi:hypothetical protein
MDIYTEQMIYTAAVYRNTNVGEVARTIGMAPSNLYRKIKQGTLKKAELDKIARALGGEYCFYILFPNGTRIGKIKNSGTTRKNKKTTSGIKQA